MAYGRNAGNGLGSSLQADALRALADASHMARLSVVESWQ
jgi:hypothetical protein